MLKCGTAELVITPALGVHIPGQFAAKPATGIKDDLMAHALVLDDGNTTLALISLDVIAVSETMTAKIRGRVSSATGILGENVLIAASHTHTGAPLDFPLYYSMPDQVTADNICYKAADAVAIAYSEMRPAGVGYGGVEEYDIAFNRRFIMKDGSSRTNPGINNPDIVKVEGPIDPQVGVLRIDAEDGSPMAVVVNFACHLDVVGGSEYCCDYPGEMRRVVREALGDVAVLFLNGCCGNINHNDYTGAHPITDRANHYKKMGRMLGGDVISAREKAYTSSDVALGALSRRVTGRRRQPTAEEYTSAKAFLASYKESDSLSEKQFAESIVELYEKPLLTREFEIQTLKIGDTAIATFPSETFVEIGLAVKDASPFKNNMTVELANGCIGYVATPKAHAGGGYETRLSRYTYMAPDTADLIVKNSAELLKQL